MTSVISLITLLTPQTNNYVIGVLRNQINYHTPFMRNQQCGDK